MPARASWKGFLRINQLAVPVKAFSACKTEPEIALHQLHRECSQRIRQQKVCPTHGVLHSDEIQSGYEFAEGQYLPLEDAELEQLLPEDEKAIAVDCFVPSAKIDPVYHSGRTYYLVPDEPPGQRPFCVLRDGMRAADRHAVARVVIGRHEQLVVLRAMGRLVAMTVLEYPQCVRPAEDYEGEVAGLSAGPAEQELIRQLIESMTDGELDVARYRDQYIDGLNELIQQRLATAEPPVIAVDSTDNEDDAALIAALRASLAAASAERSAPPPMMLGRMQRRASEDGEAARKLG